MKQIMIAVCVNYAVIGFFHMVFVIVLSRTPTVWLAVAEFLLWPRRSYQGIKAIYRDAGRLDIS